MNRQLIAASLIVGWVITTSAEPARGEVVTWDFAGNITSVLDSSGLLGGAVSVGTPFSGSLTFDSSTPDSDPDPDLATYQGTLVQLSGLIGSVPFGGPIIGQDRITIANGLPSVGSDAFNVFSGTDLGGQPMSFILNMNDPTGNAFSSTDLPVGPPDLALFDSVTIRFFTQQQGIDVKGEITVLTPDPGTLWLLGAGAAVAFRRRRLK